MAILRRLVVALALGTCVLNVQPSAVVANELSEYQLKAAFLANFAKFVEWPAQSFPEGAAPILIGIIGEDPFGRDIDDSISGKLLQGHPMAVRRVDWRDDLTHFHMAFISESEKRRLPDVLQRMESSHVLTVSDINGFCAAGGIIGFVMNNDRIRFEVNVEMAERRHLKISSKLLTLATSVHTKGN